MTTLEPIKEPVSPEVLKADPQFMGWYREQYPVTSDALSDDRLLQAYEYYQTPLDSLVPSVVTSPRRKEREEKTQQEEGQLTLLSASEESVSPRLRTLPSPRGLRVPLSPRRGAKKGTREGSIIVLFEPSTPSVQLSPRLLGAMLPTARATARRQLRTHLSPRRKEQLERERREKLQGLEK